MVQSTSHVVEPDGTTVLSIVVIAGGPFNTDCAATVPLYVTVTDAPAARLTADPVNTCVVVLYANAT